MTNVLNSFTGLVGAVAALLGGIATLLEAWRRWRDSQPRKPSKNEDIAVNKRKKAAVFTSVGIALVLISVSIFAVRVTGESTKSLSITQQPLNVRLTTAAWSAFNKKDYRTAIEKAAKCINEFQGAANREQAELKGQGAPYPPVGRASPEEQTVIFARGLLNDVATCFYIQGRSAEYLGLLEDAKRAYQQASTYTYARTWDPDGGFFWSPAQASTDRLSMLAERTR